MAQALFHAGEHRLVVAGLDIDHAVGDQPRLRHRRREQIGSGEAPEHLATTSGGNPGAEQSRRCTVNRPIAATSDLMQGP